MTPLSADGALPKACAKVLWFEPERVYQGTRIAREHPEQGHDLRRKQVALDAWRHAAEQRGPERDARDDFADHGGLLEELEQTPQRARCEDDDQQREQHVQQRLAVRTARARLGGRGGQLFRERGSKSEDTQHGQGSAHEQRSIQDQCPGRFRAAHIVHGA